MMMNAVLAVALGLTPVNLNGAPQTVRVSDSAIAEIGRYAQSIDKKGRTHLIGVDRRTGAPYDVAVDANGDVRGTVGPWYVSFSVKDAS
jgi:hypothetical protein